MADENQTKMQTENQSSVSNPKWGALKWQATKTRDRKRRKYTAPTGFCGVHEIDRCMHLVKQAHIIVAELVTR